MYIEPFHIFIETSNNIINNYFDFDSSLLNNYARILLYKDPYRYHGIFLYIPYCAISNFNKLSYVPNYSNNPNNSSLILNHKSKGNSIHS